MIVDRYRLRGRAGVGRSGFHSCVPLVCFDLPRLPALEALLVGAKSTGSPTIYSLHVSDEAPQIHVELAFAMKQEIGARQRASSPQIPIQTAAFFRFPFLFRRSTEDNTSRAFLSPAELSPQFQLSGCIPIAQGSKGIEKSSPADCGRERRTRM